MSASQGGIDHTDVVGKLKEALTRRIGEDRYRMWFDEDVTFAFTSHDSSDNEITRGCVVVSARGQFAVDRLRKHFLTELRASAAQACGSTVNVSIQLAAPAAEQTELPLASEEEARSDAASKHNKHNARPSNQDSPQPARRAASIKTLVDRHVPKRTKRNRPVAQAGITAQGQPAAQAQPPRQGQPTAQVQQPLLPQLAAEQARDAEQDQQPGAQIPPTIESFVTGDCNRLAFTAAMMACENPRSASPLFFSGPTGVGKSHLLAAIADRFRRRHRFRRVVHLSAEAFTNDFIHSVNSSGLPAFRSRYRDVDALLIDDVQFLGGKRSTIREMQYTVETLADAGRPLIFSGSHAPTEISGLSHELSGRLASGLVCPLQPLGAAVRDALLRRGIDQDCPFPWPEEMIGEINVMLSGDGRVIQGVVNLVAALQRMYGRMPTMDEIHQFGGQLLRASKPAVTLSLIENAVAQAFQLPPQTLRSQTKSRTASEPRMLAMYLSRELTSAAYSEIGRYYGGRSHSTAIVASQKVKGWLETGKTVGRGAAALSAREALDRIENIVRGA